MTAGDYDVREAVIVRHEALTGVRELTAEGNGVFALPQALVAHLDKADPARMHDVALVWSPSSAWTSTTRSRSSAAPP